MGNGFLFLNQLLLLADEAVKAKPATPSFFDMYGFPLMMMVMLFYFIVILPQKKQQQGQENFRDQLKKNDQVVTIGGIFGTISGFSADGTQVTLRIDDTVRIRVRKTSIESVVKSDGSEKKNDETPSK